MSAFAPEEDSFSDSHPTTSSTPLPREQQQTTKTPDMDASRGRQSHNPLLGNDNPLVSDLEQEVLDEYARMLGNVNQLSEKLSNLAGSPSTLTLDGLRLLERKTATVCTLLKASVYSIVLQQQIWNENQEQKQQQQEQQDQDQDPQFIAHDFGHGAASAGYEGEGDADFQ